MSKERCKKCDQLRAQAKDLEIAARICIGEIYHWHIYHNHNADFEVCQDSVCEAVRRLEVAITGVANDH